MKTPFHLTTGGITAPQGFLAAGVFCDIKRLGTGKGSEKGAKRDLGLLVSQVPAHVAGLFTTNQVCAAPVKICLSRVNRGTAQAVVANSGNANACTGTVGLRDAARMTELAARPLKLAAQDVLVCSTGRIGLPMPMAQVRRGILDAAVALDSTPEHARHFAEAIMTSDTRPKEIAVECVLGGKTVRLGGVCKGAGMIQPGMSLTGERPAATPLHATMLCFITTDAVVEAAALKSALAEAVANSFNRITVDGDMSTNDSVIILANGLAGNPPLRVTDTPPSQSSKRSFTRDQSVFQAALNHITLELAKMIVRDGEGVSRFVTVRVNGAANFADADAAARAVANSALVKTSWYGGDPNWGRILDALGYSSAQIVEERVDLGYSLPEATSVRWIMRRGIALPTSRTELKKIVGREAFEVHINLNLGRSRAVIYTADLTEAYVDFNKGE